VSANGHALARVCAATRKDGEPCRSTIVGPDGFCAMHSPERRVDPVELGRAGGLRSVEVRREQAKSVRDLLREKVEREFEVIEGVIDAGLRAPDVRDRVATLVALLAEAYGRPPVAIVGDPDQPVRFELVSAFGRLEGDE
jgi:hypothetical protein